MAVSVSIQETTIMPANGGYDVQLYISDKHRDASEPDLVLSLRTRIGSTETKLQDIQKAALNKLVEALKPLMSGLYN